MIEPDGHILSLLWLRPMRLLTVEGQLDELGLFRLTGGRDVSNALRRLKRRAYVQFSAGAWQLTEQGRAISAEIRRVKP